MGALALAKKFNNFYLGESNGVGGLVPFIIDGHRVGIISNSVLKHLPEPLFRIYQDSVELDPRLSYEERSSSVESLLKEWRKRDLFITLRGWRDECFEVRSTFDAPSLMRMERSATCLFGIRQYGVSINGYVHHPTHGLCLWLGKRSANKQTWPNYLDNMVGGGLSVGYSVIETAWKEGEEEAGLDKEWLKDCLVAAGSVSFFFESPRGLFPNTEFVFDLELPSDWCPTNRDGEVEQFQLVPVQEVLQLIQSPQFKTTSCPVALDFLVRHGIITIESEPDLPQIIELLHVPLHTIYNSMQ